MIMSKGQWKDFFCEIKKSMSRYLSIMFMVALGTAFFVGLRSSEPDMQDSLDAYMDQTGFMNIRVLSTFGMTEEDVMALGAVKGVTDAEGQYSVDVLSDLGESPKVIHVQSITGEINQLQLDEGRLPKLPDECVADWALCKEYGLKLGDKIAVYSGTDDPLEDSLAGDTFIITGIGISPDYLTSDRGSANVGTGTVTGFIAVDKSAFTALAYTQVYVCAEWLNEYNCFSDEYAEGIDELTERIEAIADERCEIRYMDVVGETYQQLKDARAELEEAKAEADEQFADAWEQIQDGQEQMQSGWDAFNSSLEEFESGKAEYESGTAAYYENLALVEDGERQIAEAKAMLDEKEAELSAGRAQVESGWAEYNEGKAQLDEAERQIAALQSVVSVAEQAYNEAVSSWESRKAELEADQAELDAKKAEYEAQGTDWQTVPELAIKQAVLDMEAEAVSGLEEGISPLKAKIDEALASYNASMQELESGKAQLEAARVQLESAQSEIDRGTEQIASARAEISAKEQELTAARAALEGGKQELDAAGSAINDAQAQIDAGRAELESGEAELNASIEEYEKAKADAEKQFADAKEELGDAEAKLAEVDYPEWYILDRNTIQSYVEYDLDAQKIGALADVFPLLFFFVAALVSLTTMTRMVEEQRTLIGTMKALGYSSGSIAAKYILYALTATLFGSLLGVLIGSKMIPWVVITAYGIMYTDMPVVMTRIQPVYSVMATAMALVCTVGATWMACRHALTSQPAALMRPVAPTRGKRIIFERIPFLWKHLNFSVKSTLRNLFRYKKRLFMTLFGIGASMALLLVGYGIQDSLEIIVTRQYGTLWVYDTAVYLEDAGDEALIAELDDYIEQNDQLGSWLDVSSQAMEAESGGVVKDITLLVPENVEELDKFIDLHHRTSGEQYKLDNSSAYISEKLADKLSLEVGDVMTIKVDETVRYEVTVGAVVENYMQYYVYMSPEAYEKTFDEEAEWNQRLILYKEGVEFTEDEEDTLAGEMLKLDSVLSIVSSASMQSTISTMLTALDYVVVILIGAAALLAFVVLYNLNNINITERKRELATIKLLGFYPGELAAYVYRENIILTALGIGVGLLLGTWLTNYVLDTVEIDMLMFGRGIETQSYVIASVITAMFSVIVNVVMYFRLQKIDMIESLKSVE